MFEIGNNGSPLSSSLKATENGMFSFSFSGVEVTVVVSYTTSTEPSVLVSCKVDNNELGIHTPNSAQNNWAICTSANLVDGDHTLVVDIPSPAGSSVFFDYILYAPSPNIQPDTAGASLRISSSDPSINYSDGFVVEKDTGSAQLTNAWHAHITVSFTGQQLTWYGVYSTSFPSTPSTAEYTIDGGSATQFSISGPTGNDGSSTTALNQVVFQTPILAEGSHTLMTTFLGDGQGTPLGLAFVVVQNSSSDTSSSPPNSPVNPPPNVPSSTTTNGGTEAFTIIRTDLSASSTQLVTTISTVLSTDVRTPITYLTTNSGGIPTTIVSISDIKSTISTVAVLTSSIRVGTPTFTMMPTSQAISARSETDRNTLIGVIAGVGILVFLLMIVTLFLRRRRGKKGTKPKGLPGFLPSANTNSSDDRIPLRIDSTVVDGTQATRKDISSSGSLSPSSPAISGQELGMGSAGPNQPRPLTSPAPQSLYTLIPGSAIFGDQHQQQENNTTTTDGNIRRTSQAVDINSNNRNHDDASTSNLLDHLHVDDMQQLLRLRRGAMGPEVGDVGADFQVSEISPREMQMDSGIRLGLGRTLSYRSQSSLTLKEKLPPTYTLN